MSIQIQYSDIMDTTDLIPGLPYDVGLECLVRVPYQSFSSVTSVCKSWKIQIDLTEFWRRRKASGSARRLVVMPQARVDPAREHGLKKYGSPPVYRLTVLEPETGRWAELPPIPALTNGALIFSQLVRVGSELVVVGGCDPLTWEVSRDVHIYNFISAKWRRGAEMPGPSRRFFACASDSKRMVYVAGGHDGEKCALKSAIVYDVANDTWTPLPDMAMERDEAKGIFRDGRFYVVGGYATNIQGGFRADAESFDADTWQWGPVQEDFMDRAECPRNCVSDEDGNLFTLREDDVAMMMSPREGGQQQAWRVVTKFPGEVRHVAHLTAWSGKLMVIGCERFGWPYKAFLLDLKSCKWEVVGGIDEEFSGHVQSGCCLEL